MASMIRMKPARPRSVPANTSHPTPVRSYGSTAAARSDGTVDMASSSVWLRGVDRDGAPRRDRVDHLGRGRCGLVSALQPRVGGHGFSCASFEGRRGARMRFPTGPLAATGLSTALCDMVTARRPVRPTLGRVVVVLTLPDAGREGVGGHNAALWRCPSPVLRPGRLMSCRLLDV